MAQVRFTDVVVATKNTEITEVVQVIGGTNQQNVTIEAIQTERFEESELRLWRAPVERREPGEIGFHRDTDDLPDPLTSPRSKTLMPVSKVAGPVRIVQQSRSNNRRC
jgi:hypothetical protein